LTLDLRKALDNKELDKSAGAADLRNEILRLTGEYYKSAHVRPPFVAGRDPVPVSGRVYDDIDLQALVASSLDFWLTTGRFNDRFEEEFRDFLGASYAMTANSGSSANLLAITTLCSKDLGKKSMRPGDEVVTVAAGFPTTVNPIIQNGLVPVFVDVDIPTYNPTVEAVQEAISSKTRAIVLAHTLGNPFAAREMRDIAKDYGLWLVEDCCDALGSKYDGQKVGTFGDIATFSFYPAHHITMGEGGAVVTNDPELARLATSLRDWGRDCHCPPGRDNTCGHRFDGRYGGLPAGYDHKYVYSSIGYNLKITDMQAAIGLAQLEHLPGFIERRRANFQSLRSDLGTLERYLILPEGTAKSEPSWFGFPVTIRNGDRHRRVELLKHLNNSRIDTRLLFGGNLMKQPCMKGVRCKVSGSLSATDKIMNDSFWVGIYPGLSDEMLRYVGDRFEAFFESSTSQKGDC
jgi:CDP-6-deoxy-D-xylo-4-hexulose-3-dehydrase